MLISHNLSSHYNFFIKSIAVCQKRPVQWFLQQCISIWSRVALQCDDVHNRKHVGQDPFANNGSVTWYSCIAL